MEAVLAIQSPERGREMVLPLSLGGIRLRTIVQSGGQLAAEVAREPAEVLLLPETLPDGTADMWLAKIAAVAPRRPLAVVLVYGVEASEAIRERVRAVYGPGADVVPAGARAAAEVAAEVARVVDRLAAMLAEQDRDAYERLRQPVAAGVLPQPVRTEGAIAFCGLSGGVGTSTLVANLATTAAMAGHSVLVVDAAFATGGSIAHHLGVELDDQNRGMHHLRWAFGALDGGAREGVADELQHRLMEVRIPRIRHAEFRLLHIPAILDQMATLSAEQITWAMQTLGRSFQVVLIDCGTGFGDARTQKFLQAASRAFLLVGGWGTSVHSLARGLMAWDAKQNSRERLFLLLREATEGAFGARTVGAVARMPIFGRIPEDALVRKTDARLGVQVPLVVENQQSPFAKTAVDLAFALGLTEQVAAAKDGQQRRGLFGRLRR